MVVSPGNLGDIGGGNGGSGSIGNDEYGNGNGNGPNGNSKGVYIATTPTHTITCHADTPRGGGWLVFVSGLSVLVASI